MKPYHSLLSLVLIVLASCKSVPKVDTPPEPKPSTGVASATIDSIVDHTGNSVGIIKRDAGSIVTDTQSIREILEIQEIARVPASDSIKTVTDEKNPTRESAIRTLDRIDSKAQNIIESSDSISSEVSKLESLTKEVNDLEKSLSSLQIALDQTKAKALEKLYGYISMFWVIGFILIAAGGAVAFFLNKGYGSSLALLGVLMIGFASAAQYYMQEIALVGAILVVVGFLVSIGMIVWSGINGKRNATAIREIVEMIQILKETMTDSERDRIFGKDGIASHVQSDITKEIVAKIREQNGFKKLDEARKSLRASDPPPDGIGVTGGN